MKYAWPGPVLILGAGSDIALAMTRQLAADGYRLQLAARRPEALAGVAEDLEIRHAAKATIHAFDAQDVAGFEAFWDSLPEEPRIVICAVGMMGDQDASIGEVDGLQSVIATNFTGPALFLEIAARRMAQTNEPAAVVGIGSVAGDRGRKLNYVYGSAKAGFAEYLSGLRQKHIGGPVHVMTVKPGFVRTAMTADLALPGPLTSEPEDLAKAVLQSLDKKHFVYYHWKWWLVMAIIKLIPERIFARLKF